MIPSILLAWMVGVVLAERIFLFLLVRMVVVGGIDCVIFLQVILGLRAPCYCAKSKN